MPTGDEHIGDALVADAVAGELQVTRNDGKSTCRNCEAVLQGRYCHQCGQLADALHRPIFSLFAEAVEGLFAYDGRLWRTLFPLLLRPGAVTRDYLDGHRARFVQPFRFLLFVSVIFFLIIGLGGDDSRQIVQIKEGGSTGGAAVVSTSDEKTAGGEDQAPPQTGDHPSDGSVVVEGICAFRAALHPKAPATNCDSVASTASTTLDGNVLPGGVRERVAANLDRMAGDPQLFAEAFARHLPKALFIMFPIYALFLALLYPFRKGVYFFDHLIFSMHYHAAFMILILFVNTVGSLLWDWLAFLIFIAVSHWQIFTSLRRVYRSGWFSTAFRVVVLDIAYLVVSGAVLGLVAMFSLYALN